MAAGPAHWPVYIKTRFARTLTWYASKTEYDADPTTASKVNLTGYTGEAIIRKLEGDSAAVLTFTTDNDSLTLGGSAGTTTFLLGGDVVSDDVDPGRYVMDLILTDASANVLPPLLVATLEFSLTVTLQ